MSHPYLHDDSDGPITMKPSPRPRNRRNFELASEPPSAPPTPPAEPQSTFSSQFLQPLAASTDGSSTPSRTRSILNLTSSTLFGIYQPTGYAADREEASTPWGTGAQTPIDSSHGSFDLLRASMPESAQQKELKNTKQRRRSTVTQRPHVHQKPRRGFRGYFLPLAGRIIALFAVGVLYGLLISQLHERKEIAPVHLDGLDRRGRPYLTFWGLAGVLLGEALPRIDRFWLQQDDDDAMEEPEEEQQQKRSNRGTGDWLDVVRSIGAFVGIAFAIRKLPWQSTLQLSLTLALANPAVWYLIDRSPPGFFLSTVVAVSGTAVLLGINPALVPSPSPAQVLKGLVARHGSVVNATASALQDADKELVLGVFSHESIGVATWIASVLFVSTVCFGNIGRRLAPRSLK